MSLALSVLALGGCSSSTPPAPTGEHTATAASRIQGGVDDPNDPAVVGIAAVFGYGAALCSGSLIAPNLVLTAHHCVAQTSTEAVDCSTTSFSEPFSPDSFYVTTSWNGMETRDPSTKYYSVADVWLPPWQDDIFCGQDIALLRLAEPIPPTEALPIPPRIDEPVHKKESYRAVGFGATDTTGRGAGHRRTRDGLFVVCADDCNGPSFNNEYEWGGNEGICSGDSGGPALDSNGRVIGVVSRGGNFGNTCIGPIYTAVEAWGDWLQERAQRAASLGEYEPPRWATGGSTMPETDAQVLVPEGGVDDGGPDVETGPPHGTAGPAEPCSTGYSCASDVCVADAFHRRYCSELCSDDDPLCPDGMVCNFQWGACMLAPETGKPCKDTWDCRSHRCLANDDGKRYCADPCSASAPKCPFPATCDTDIGACVLSSAQTRFVPAGGCSLSRSADSPRRSEAMLILAAAGLLLWSRRRS